VRRIPSYRRILPDTTGSDPAGVLPQAIGVFWKGIWCIGQGKWSGAPDRCGCTDAQGSRIGGGTIRRDRSSRCWSRKSGLTLRHQQASLRRSCGTRSRGR